MGLPTPGRRSETVQIGDVEITVTALHLFQIRELAEMPRDESDAAAIAWATGVTPEEAHQWIVDTGGGAGVELLAAIMRVSGWDPDAGKRFPA